MSTISVEETFFPDRQEVRIILRNEMGYVVYDMTEPLVVCVTDSQGIVSFVANDIDSKVAAAIKLQEDRNTSFLQAAAARGIIVP